MELLNFSLDRGGLANWWSVLTRHVATREYELDGLLFAVFYGDLYRGFTLSEHRGYTRHMLGRAASWDPDTWPRSLREARRLGTSGCQLPFKAWLNRSGDTM